MPMNQVIREKRKARVLTQEQVADALGVSAPAVNKWESGATYPDITLLPALARLLKIDVNALLCFSDGLSQQEVGRFCQEVIDTIRKSGFEPGFAMSIEKIQEYPSCGFLIHSAAMLLDGALIMSALSAEDKEKYSRKITALYERAAKSDDEEIRDRATFMLASKYMGYGEYAKAQEMLDLLPEKTAIDKKQMQANLWIKQDKLTEAAELLERKLLLSVSNEVQILLISLADIAMKEGREQDASRLAEISRRAVGLFDLWDYNSFVVPLHVALAEENTEDSIALIKSLLAAALIPWDMQESALYRHIAAKANQAEAGKIMLPGLLSEFENGPKYAFLRSNPEFRQMIGHYRAKCGM